MNTRSYHQVMLSWLKLDLEFSPPLSPPPTSEAISCSPLPLSYLPYYIFKSDIIIWTQHFSFCCIVPSHTFVSVRLQSRQSLEGLVCVRKPLLSFYSRELVM